jgi:hypothetical protein
MAITYQEMRREDTRDGRRKVVVQFFEGSASVSRTNFHFASEAEASAQLSARISAKMTILPFKLNILNELDIPGIDDPREFIKDLVIYIRGNPTATDTQLSNVIDSAYPNIPYKPGKMYDQLKVLSGLSFTFAQFKTYLINKKFIGVDD